MKHSTQPPTKADQERFERLKFLGCVACAHLGVPNVQELQIHHLLQGNQRMGHLYTIPLCRSHHVGFMPNDHKWMSDEDRVSIADGRKAFTRIYPSERELWERVQDRLHEPKEWPVSKRVPRVI